MTMYAFCGRTREHPTHKIRRNGVAFQCSGELLHSDMPFEEEVLGDMNPPAERHTSPKGVSWDQFQLFDPESIPEAYTDDEGFPSPTLTRAQELAAWWMENALAECRSLVPKAISYGSVDLDIMGKAMLSLMPGLKGKMPPQELALAFYALGKISRIIGAMEQGVEPSADSWVDLAIYAKMAIRVREKGYW